MQTERYKQKLMLANREISKLRKVVEAARSSDYTPTDELIEALRELDKGKGAAITDELDERHHGGKKDERASTKILDAIDR